MRLLSEGGKVDAAIQYQALATPAPGIISRYFRMDKYCKALFMVIVDTLALAETVVCNLMEAAVNTGVAGAAIATGTCTITANTLASVITITVGAGTAVGNTVTVNGVVFTAAAAPDHPNQVFDQSSGVAITIATDLAACMVAAASAALLTAASNGAGVTVVDDLGAVLTLTITEAGESSLTVTSNTAPNLAIATVQAIAYLEAEDTAHSLPTMEWYAIQLIGAATINASVTLYRGGEPRYTPTQYVAAHDYDD
ncbi:MAG TPA: hypothetical protein VM537_05720 [Anaerolineae bacterium]|nr:hypothetical protein [Anaerolineae bacterium]